MSSHQRREGICCFWCGSWQHLGWRSVVPVWRLLVCKIFHELVGGLGPNVRRYNIWEWQRIVLVCWSIYWCCFHKRIMGFIAISFNLDKFIPCYAIFQPAQEQGRIQKFSSVEGNGPKLNWQYDIYFSPQLILQRESIEDIYFFEVNTKYNSSSVLKTSEFSWVRSTYENFDVCNSRDEIYLVFTKKSKLSFYFILF